MNSLNKRSFWTVGLAGVFAVTAPALGDEPTIDDLLDLPGSERPRQTDPQQTPEGQQGGPRLDESVERMLTMEEAADLFRKIVRDMDDVAQVMETRQEVGLTTQRRQEEILRQLDQVIATAREQQSQQSGGQGGQSGEARQQDSGSSDVAGREAQQSQAEASQGEGEHQGEFSPGDVTAHGEGEGLHENRVEWGHLPPRLRDELQQGFGERFSSVYRELTEAYYRRLAEEGR